MHISGALIVARRFLGLLLFLFLVGQAGFSKLWRQLCLLFAQDEVLIDVALIDFVDITATAVVFLLEHSFYVLGLITKQFLLQTQSKEIQIQEDV